MSENDELRRAVRKVIEQNRSIGYPPNRFIQATEDGFAANIVEVCERLLTNPETLQHLEPAVKAFRNLLTLEDEVTEHPTGFGLSDDARRSAQDRVTWFLQISPGRRS